MPVILALGKSRYRIKVIFGYRVKFEASLGNMRPCGGKRRRGERGRKGGREGVVQERETGGKTQRDVERPIERWPWKKELLFSCSVWALSLMQIKRHCYLFKNQERIPPQEQNQKTFSFSRNP